ncbi:MAG: hypothetical protein R3E10_04470 [Gemmatimonadota bacterium]
MPPNEHSYSKPKLVLLGPAQAADSAAAPAAATRRSLAIDRDFRLAVEALALQPQEQAQLFENSCVTCGLVTRFSTAATAFEGLWTGRLAAGQARLLQELRESVAGLTAADLTCFRSDVLTRPGWAQVRRRAVRLALALGWSEKLPLHVHRSRTAR